MERTPEQKRSRTGPNTGLARRRSATRFEGLANLGNLFIRSSESPPAFGVGERETNVEQHSTSTAKFSDRRSDGPQRGRCPRQLHGASGSGFGHPGRLERTGVLAGDKGRDIGFHRQDRSTPKSGALENR